MAFVHRDGDSAFGVHVPGCFSAADCWNNVHANAVAALRFWFEKAAPIEPWGLEEIREMAAAGLAAGASLMVGPLVEVPYRKASVNVSIDQGVMSAIDSEARRRGQARAALIAEAARREIEGSN